ncbi:MAG: ABC transporter ATP-binding protein [Actinobacteria bacterium]|nr:ABC transporter ATP-binding protein [Actinomycetota bacterium]
MALLETTNLSKSFGGVVVIDDLSVALEEGTALGVVGPNGAGKTTLFNLITGTYHPDAGRVVFAGVDITHRPKYERSRQGMGRTFQIPRPFEKMTVFENVLVGATHGRGQRERVSYACAVSALEQAGMLHRANMLAGSLPLLDRKRLELARVLAVQPRVLLLDEIAGGLTEPEVKVLIEQIRRLRSEGVTIIWIEHIVNALLAVVDRIVAINFGRKLIEGDPRTVMNSPELHDVYLGSEPV